MGPTIYVRFSRWCGLLLVGMLAGCGADGLTPAPTQDNDPLRVMTFNVGIPECANDPDAAYTCDDAEIAGEWYGTGLSHRALFADTAAFFRATRPDVVALQEIFHAGNCPEIPPEFHPGFICEGWQPGDLTVSQIVLGEDYQIACHQGRPDKCLAVHREAGRFAGCADGLCLDHLQGGQTSGCGGGTRVGRGVIVRPDGTQFTVVNVHGTSGVTLADQDCRVEQIEQIFVDLQDGRGEPGANGTRNIVLGDLNTDPVRFAALDRSARTWRAFVGPDRPFRQISAVGLLVEPTYAGLINIDHVAADAWQGDCFSASPTDIVAYDHQPIVCDLSSDRAD